jgi:hypothetical protein
MFGKKTFGKIIGTDEELEAIRAFSKRLSQLPLNDLSISTLAEIEKRRKGIELKGPEIGDIAENLIVLLTKYFHILNVLSLKTNLLVEGALTAQKDNNPVVYVMCTRGLMEHAGSFSYLSQKLEKAKIHLEKQKTSKKIRLKISQILKDLDKSYYGSSFFGSENSTPIPVHTSDLMRSLKKDMASAERHYDFLCEFVHPNYGSNLFVSEGEFGEGRAKVDTPRNRDVFKGITAILWAYSNYLEDIMMTSRSTIIWLDMSITNCLHESTKADAIFQKPPLKYVGDGHSRETAIYFTSARSKMEHLELHYSLLEKRGIDLKSRKNCGTGDGYVFDMYQTSDGEIWFKSPLKF